MKKRQPLITKPRPELKQAEHGMEGNSPVEPAGFQVFQVVLQRAGDLEALSGALNLQGAGRQS